MLELLHAIQYNVSMLVLVIIVLGFVALMYWLTLRYRAQVNAPKQQQQEPIAETEVLKMEPMRDYADGYSRK